VKVNEIITEAANPAQQAAIAISMKKANKKLARSPRTKAQNLRKSLISLSQLLNDWLLTTVWMLK
jgi:hypothetical protein